MTLRRVLGTSAAVVAIAGTAWNVRADRASSAPDGSPVVVELFSSEGCSSCPPADAFLSELATRGNVAGVPVLALEYHVDYWDYLGWKDPYSRGEFSDRQGAYARAFGEPSVYTPEIVVQGRAALSNRSEATLSKVLRTEAAASLARVEVRTDGPWITVHVTPREGIAAGGVSDVFLAITESGLRSEVSKGENAGKNLIHAPVVRRLTKVGVTDGKKFDTRTPTNLDASWNANNVRYVAFVQDQASRRITGAVLSARNDVWP